MRRAFKRCCANTAICADHRADVVVSARVGKRFLYSNWWKEGRTSQERTPLGLEERETPTRLITAPCASFSTILDCSCSSSNLCVIPVSGPVIFLGLFRTVITLQIAATPVAHRNTPIATSRSTSWTTEGTYDQKFFPDRQFGLESTYCGLC